MSSKLHNRRSFTPRHILYQNRSGLGMTTGPKHSTTNLTILLRIYKLGDTLLENIPPMKKLLFLLSGLCLYCLAACDNDHEPTKPVRPFHGDTLAQIAWNFRFIVENHYHSIPGIVPERTTYRVPVIPRSVEDKTEKSIMTWTWAKRLTWFSEPRCTAIRSIVRKENLRPFPVN